MIRNSDQTILVVNDVEATRQGIKEMLTDDGYQIETAEDEHNAVNEASCRHFDLLLVSLEGETEEVIESVRRIREDADLEENVPVIIFCADSSDEVEFAVEPGIYLSCPDDFNQMRSFISRLLTK